MLQKLGLKEASDHPSVDQQGAREGTAEGRGAQLRDPQAAAQIHDVMNDQRKVVYEQRKEIMQAPDVAATISDMRHEVVEGIVARASANALPDAWTSRRCTRNACACSGSTCDRRMGQGRGHRRRRDQPAHRRRRRPQDGREGGEYGPDIMRQVEKSLLLQLLDQTWKDHLLQLDICARASTCGPTPSATP